MKSILQKFVVITLVTLLFASFLNISLPYANAAGTFIVPDDYLTIQAALDAAGSQTTIYVRSGVYEENVSIPYGRWYIDIVGEDTLDTVLNGSFLASYGSGYISVEHLTITGPVQVDYGVEELNPNFRLSDCVVNSNIVLSTTNSSIENNVIRGSLTFISALHIPASLNVVRNNTFLGSGIILNGMGGGAEGGCSNNLITDNTIISASVGITEEGRVTVGGPECWDNLISRNTIFNCSVGILSENGWSPRNTNITQNTIESNVFGIGLINVSGIGLWQNNFVTNNQGLNLSNVNSISIWGNNFLHNTWPTATVWGGGFTWDNGYLAGGNYWSNYNGTDFYHGPIQSLFGADGIGDTPYVIYGFLGNYTDRYPLMVANPRIIVSNTVEGEIPPDPWNGIITDNGTGALVANFTLPAAGGESMPSYWPEPVGKFYSITQGGVTQLVEPIRGNVSAQDFYAYNVSVGSGFAPYMEAGKSKIYLYEDTVTGALSLIIHHNKYLALVNFWVNMTLGGLPIGTDVLLQDDPTAEDFLGLMGGGVAFGYWWVGNWSGGNSDGGILGGLEYPESVWNITAQMLFTTGISAWEYQTESGPIALNMSEPLTISSENVVTREFLIAQHRKLGYDTSIIVNGITVPTITENSMDMALVSLGPDDTISVEFDNIPTGAYGKTTGTWSSVGWTYNLPCGVPILVQAALEPNINGGGIDLVKDKPTVIFVNISDVRARYDVLDNDLVKVAIYDNNNLFNNLFSVPIKKLALAQTNITVFYPNAPNIPVTDDQVTAVVSKQSIPTDPWTNLSSITRSVTVKETSELALYYACLNRAGDYGVEPLANYTAMVGNATDFINATYPIPNLTVDTIYKDLLGNQSTGSSLGLLKDCQWLAQLAKLQFPNRVAVGIGIGPNTTVGGTYKNYFAYHGATDKQGNVAVGVSFGPGTRGVVVMDGYYTAAAHELGHTFNLYYGVPEQYQSTTDYPGKKCNGFNPTTKQQCTGYDFMGLSPYRRTDITWVNTTSTYEYLFRNTTKVKNDPEILLVNGIIYKDGTVEFPLDWYHLQEGTPDTLPPGDFALRFVDADNHLLGETSFDAPFFMQIDPGMSVGEDLPDISGFGKVDTDFAGFSFATAYPEGTAEVQLVNMTDPDPQKQVIGTVEVQDIVNVVPPATTETHTGTEGSNGWYTSNVDVTLTATATGEIGVKEIHYTLDGTPNVIQGATAIFTISTEGTHSLSYWAVDNSGSIEPPHSQTIKIDKTPPTVELTLPQPLLHQAASATWIATDSISDVDGPASGTVAVDTSSVGPKTVTVTVKDYAGNSRTVTGTCYVTYAFSEFLEPINNDGTSIFKLGSTVPVKFQLKDAQGNLISTAVAKIYVTKITNAVLGDEMEPVSTSAATTGNLFRYTGDQYIFNLGTKTLSKGTWQIKVVLDDGTTKTVRISLR